MKAAKVAGDSRMIIDLRKSPRAWEAIFESEDFKTLSKTKLIFEKPAKEVVSLLPTMSNFIATLCLAWGNGENAIVRAIRDPSSQRSVTRITTLTKSWEFTAELSNEWAETPKMNYITICSALAMLGELNHPIRIGT